MKRIVSFDKKIFSIVLSAFLPALFLPFSAVHAQAEETVRLEKEDFTLSLPSSYEQYLPLEDISDLDFHGENIVVADGNRLYVYNGERYLSYTHTAKIEQTEFTRDGELFFLDSGMGMYSVNYTQSDLSPEKLNFNCTSFTYVDGEVYYAKLDGIYRLGKSDSVGNGGDISKNYPRIAYENDTLYYTVSNRLYICKGNSSNWYSLDHTPTDVCVDGNTLFACDDTGLYSYDLSGDLSTTSPVRGVSVADSSADAFSRFSIEKGNVYLSVSASSGAKIRRFSLEENSFSDYEIGVSSDAENRLKNAQTAASSEDLLVIADADRFLIKQGGMSGFKTVSLPFSPRYIATNGSSVFVASDEKAQLYDANGNLIDDLGKCTVRGVVCGIETDYYIARGNSTYHRYSPDDKQLSTEGIYLNTSFKEATADPYGNLYVLDTAGSVYRYVSNKTGNFDSHELYCTVPSNASSLRVDREGNLYLLTGGRLLRIDRDGTKQYFTLPSDVFFGTQDSPLAITLDDSDGSISFVYRNYILSSNSEKLSLPALTEMATSDAYRQIYQTEKNLSLVRIEENALQIPFTLGELTETSSRFAADSFLRGEKARSAILLAELVIDGSDYYALCPTDGSSAVLVRTEYCAFAATEDFLLPAEGFIDDIGYLSNQTYLYKIPYIEPSLAYERLDKSAAVRIEGYFTDEDNATFYYVTHNGKSGFVPAGYVQKLNTATNESNLLRFTTVRCSSDVTATALDGTTVTLYSGTNYTVGILNRSEGIAYIVYSSEGKTYYAEIPETAIQEKESSYIRYFLVVVLLLADLLVVGNYVYKRKNDEIQ